MPEERLSERVYRWLIIGATIAFTGVTLAWALLTPAFRAPDEPMHLNSVERLVYGGGWPAPQEARLSSGVVTAMAEAQFKTQLPGTSANWGETAFVDTSPPDRWSVIDASNGLGDPSHGNDQMTQHPPLYYAVAAGVIRATGSDGTSWVRQLLMVRLTSVLMVAAIPWIAAACALLLSRRRTVAVAAAWFPLAVPQFSHIAGSASNDALTVLLVSLAVLGTTTIVVRGLSWRRTLLTGLALGGALFTKGLALPLIPIVAAAFLVAAKRPAWRERLVHAATGMGVAFVSGGFWWAINLARYGSIQPAGSPPRWEPSDPAGRSLRLYLPSAVRQLAESFWARFSWLEIRIPVQISVALTLALLATIAYVLWRGRAFRKATTFLVAFPVLTTVSLLVKIWSKYWEFGVLPGLQGRYLFGGLAGLGAVVATATIVGTRAPRARRVARSALILVAAGFAVAGFLFGLQAFYRGPGDGVGATLSRWGTWSLAGGSGVGVGLAFGAIALALAAWSAIVVARTEEAES